MKSKRYDNMFSTQAKARNQWQKRAISQQLLQSNSKVGKLFGAASLGAASALCLSSFLNEAHADEGVKKVDKNQKQRLLRIFSQFASDKDPVSGEPLMSPEDFIKSVVQRTPNDQQTVPSSDNPTLQLLFKMADKNEAGKINFSEYVLLFKLLTTPESEFEMAFRMFDLNKDGTVSKEEFKQVMRANKDHVNVDFDFDCDLMTRFFGRDGSTQLSYIQFAHFMKLLNEEIRKQEFRSFDKEGKGFIDAATFGELLTKYISKGELSPKLKANLENLKNSFKDAKISFAEYDAFNRIMSNIPGIASALKYSANKEGVITKDSFTKATKSVTGITLSPMEVSIIFKMFSSNDGYDALNKQDYEEFINFLSADLNRRQQVLDLWIQDKIAHDEPRALTSMERFWNATVKLALKTLYGGVAGAIGATAVYPIDMVKTRMQNQRSRPGAPQLYKNSIDCFQQIYRHEGWKGLYRGLIPQLVGVAPEKAIKLVTNDYLRDVFGRPGTNDIYLPLEILAGGGAGASQVVFTNPIEIVKIRLQIQGEIARTTGVAPKGAMEIVRELGFAGLYRGASACFARDIPFSALYFPVYAALKESFKEPGEKETKPSGHLLAGCIAGGLAASSTTPFDVVKTRLQVEARAGQDTYSGWFDCFFKVLRNEGWTALWKGILPRTVRSSPQFGVTLLAYEALHKVVPPVEDKRQNMPASVPVGEDQLVGLRELYYQKVKSFKKLFGN